MKYAMMAITALLTVGCTGLNVTHNKNTVTVVGTSSAIEDIKSLIKRSSEAAVFACSQTGNSIQERGTENQLGVVKPMGMDLGGVKDPITQMKEIVEESKGLINSIFGTNSYTYTQEC